jgi:hypothetical protein
MAKANHCAGANTTRSPSSDGIATEKKFSAACITIPKDAPHHAASPNERRSPFGRQRSAASDDTENCEGLGTSPG